jgi:hypothetical protein
MCIHQPRAAALYLLLGLTALSHMVLFGQNAAPTANGQDGTPQPKQDAADEKAIRGLIAQLGDDSFEKRESAQKRLAGVGEPALELLRTTAKASADQEVRERAARCIQAIERQLFRAVDKQWGVAVDPEGDCTFRVDAGRLHITSRPVNRTLCPGHRARAPGGWRATETVGVLPASRMNFSGRFAMLVVLSFWVQGP